MDKIKLICNECFETWIIIDPISSYCVCPIDPIGSCCVCPNCHSCCVEVSENQEDEETTKSDRITTKGFKISENYNVDKRFKIKEYPGYRWLFEKIKKENNVKQKNARCVWYIINLALEAKRTNNPSIEIFTGHKTLKKYVNFYKGNKNVTRKILLGLIRKLQDNGFVDYKKGGFTWKLLKNNNYKKLFRHSKITFRLDFMELLVIKHNYDTLTYEN